MCIGTFVATLFLTLLAVAVVMLILYVGRESKSKCEEGDPEQPSLFGDVVPGFDHDPDEFTQRIYRTFSQSKKGR